MEVLILFLLVIFAVFVVARFASRTKRKIRKYTKPLKQKRSYQSPRKSFPERQSALNEQQKSSQTAYKTKSQRKSQIIEWIENFPEVKVEHIIDGDTVIVVKNWDKIKIRLDSIDCPEAGQHWGDTAKYGLIKLIGGRKVRFEEHGIDAHERTIATLYVQHGDGSEWMNVNERMVTLGHAWVMRRFYKHLPKPRQQKLNQLERWAKSKRVGLWKTESPLPPWKWRKTENEVN